MKQTKEQGITLIALIITVIILVILAAVSINAVMNTDLIGAAQKGATDYTQSAINENKILEDTASIMESTIEKINDMTGGSSGSGTASVLDIYDSTGEVEGKLHIGDFVNYTAGTWTDADMTTIGNSYTAPNNSTSLPSGNFQFGGFTTGSSRDSNATVFNTTYNYAKDSSGNAISGWRVFDVDESTGVMTLISAGCPEDYYHSYGTDYGYISEYILTGNVNSSADATTSLGLGTTYKARDWSMYVNSSYATSAKALTKAILDTWYTKYTGIASADTYTDGTFRKVYGTKYETLIDIYSYYWLSFAGGGNDMCLGDPYGRYVGFNDTIAFGVRVLVTLSPDIKLSDTAQGTTTVVDPRGNGNDQTYNIWGLTQ